MKKLLFLFFLPLLLTSCTTDFKLTGEYKDIAVVYGLLNQNDTTQVLRIEKAFLGEQNALVMSQQFDSLYYDTTKLSVKLFDDQGQEIIFHPVVDNNKEPGDFSNPLQILYESNANLNPNRTYNLVITKGGLGDSTTSSTPLIKDFSISKPDVAQQAMINFLTSPGTYFNYPVIWRSTVNGISHRVTVRFYYREVDLNNLSDTILKHIDWIQPTDQATTTDGGEGMQRSLSGEEFFRFLQSNIAPYNSDTNNVKRLIGKGKIFNGDATDHLDFIFYVGCEALYNYLDLNAPSIGLVQEKPTYTNINNGLGVFSCRYSKTVPNKTLNNYSVEELRSGQYTVDLNFVTESD